MPISEPNRGTFTGTVTREVTCSKCNFKTKTLGGSKKYASQVLARHNAEKHAKK